MNIRNSLSRLGLKPGLLFVVFTMTGCASGPAFQQINDIPADKGLVYIYRTKPALLHGVGAAPDIVINDLRALRLEAGSYYPYFSAPGETTISAARTFSKRSIKIDVHAGETYYVKAGISFGSSSPYIKSVSTKDGLEEIEDCKRLKQVPGV